MKYYVSAKGKRISDGAAGFESEVVEIPDDIPPGLREQAIFARLAQRYIDLDWDWDITLKEMDGAGDYLPYN
jgi:hypothetical protein